MTAAPTDSATVALPSAAAEEAVLSLADLIKAKPAATPQPVVEPIREIGGRKDGPDPTRYGDWEKNGRCIDF